MFVNLHAAVIKARDQVLQGGSNRAVTRRGDAPPEGSIAKATHEGAIQAVKHFRLRIVPELPTQPFALRCAIVRHQYDMRNYAGAMNQEL